MRHDDWHIAASPLEAALALAARSLAVCHIYPRSKVPGPANGFDGATTAPDVLRTWFAACPGAGVGLNLAKSNLIALDVDPRHGGITAMHRLRAEYGELPRTVRTQSGRGDGGGHLIFMAPSNIPAVRLAGASSPWPGVDLLAGGGLILPPSLHADTGKTYRWVHAPGEVPFAQAPDWLIKPLLAYGRRQKEARQRKAKRRVSTGRTIYDRARAAMPIEVLASRLTTLRGRSYLKGRCPLHDESHGQAFVVWPEDGSWHCFGACNTGGDVVKLAQLARDGGLL